MSKFDEYIEKKEKEFPVWFASKEKIAQWILEDPAIVEQFERAKVNSDYEKITQNILAKYDMMRIMGKVE